jgi:hypothetical protein
VRAGRNTSEKFKKKIERMRQREADTFLTATDVADREVYYDVEPSD